ncbi:MAG: hypothetical protein GY730_03235 [bacterium]|nr:hypothetical protein [bacterium]
MSDQMQPFTEPRPMAFPPRIAVYQDKQYNLNKEGYSVNEFDKALDKKLEEIEAFEKEEAQLGAEEDSDLDQDFDTLSKKQILTESERDRLDLYKKKKAVQEDLGKVQFTRAASDIKMGLSFLPRLLIARGELTGTKNNLERIDDDDYINTADLFTKMDIENVDLENRSQNLYGNNFYAELLKKDSFTASQNTWAHNFNNYGRDSMIFKEFDTKNWEIFKKSRYFAPLHNKSMTTQRALEKRYPGIYKDMQKELDSVINKIEERLDLGHNLNIKNIADQFKDNVNTHRKQENVESEKTSLTYDADANINTIVTSGAYKNFDKKQSFALIMDMWEKSSRFTRIINSIAGPASELNTLVSEEAKKGTKKTALEKRQEEIEASLSFDELEELEEELKPEMIQEQLESKLTDKMLSWWNSIEGGLDDIAALSFGMALSSAPVVFELMDFTKSGIEELEGSKKYLKELKASDFEKKILGDSLNYIRDEIINADFLTGGVLKKQYLGPEGSQFVEKKWSALIKAEYIKVNGEITDKFDNKGSGFGKDLPFEQSEIDNMYNAFLKASAPGLSFDAMDQTKSGGFAREDIKVICSDGKARNIPELLAMIGSGAGMKEKKENLHIVHEELIKIFAEVTGVNLKSKVTGRANGLDMDNDEVVVNISDEAQWREYNPSLYPALDENGESIYEGGLENKTGSLNIKFKTREHLNNFVDDMRSVIALIEPVLGVFEGEKNIPFLRDNAGSMDRVEIITEDSENYEMWLDYKMDKNVFKTDIWKNSSAKLNMELVKKVSHRMHTTLQINKLLRMANKNDHEEYTEKKEEHDEEEYERVRALVKHNNKRIKNNNEFKKQKQIQAKQKEAEVRAHKKKQDARSAAKMKAQNKNNKKK